MDHHPQAGLGLERRPDALVAEPHALELGSIVLEREIRVPGSRVGDPADLALDPQVAEPFVRPDEPGNDVRCLADGEDPEPERPRRAQRALRGRDLRIHGLIVRAPRPLA